MRVELIMFKENGEQKQFAIDPGKTVIGRKDDCHLRIPLPEVSRRHAVMIVDEQSVTLRDLGSANGTYINNNRISEQELDAGDHIVIGSVVFTIRINGEPSSIKQVQTRLEARTPARKASAPAGKTAVPDQPGAPAKARSPKDAEVFEGVFGEQVDEDPISALEALAGTDDTAAIDLDDSFPDLDDSRT